jgi:hypothetical protein
MLQRIRRMPDALQPLVTAAYVKNTPHSEGFVRLASEALVPFRVFYKAVN